MHPLRLPFVRFPVLTSVLHSCSGEAFLHLCVAGLQIQNTMSFMDDGLVSVHGARHYCLLHRPMNVNFTVFFSKTLMTDP